MGSAAWAVTVVLFEGFELLDVAGPVELFSLVPGTTIRLAAPDPGLVPSNNSVALSAPHAIDDISESDLVLIPGGAGTRALVHDEDFLSSLRRLAERSPLVAAVCTGSALLAAAGLLDGYRATSNKKAFNWVTSIAPTVEWLPVARWVHDRDRWTSSGVAAGMDMAYALISDSCGAEAAATAALHAELEIHSDPHWDPFASEYGLNTTN